MDRGLPLHYAHVRTIINNQLYKLSFAVALYTSSANIELRGIRGGGGYFINFNLEQEVRHVPRRADFFEGCQGYELLIIKEILHKRTILQISKHFFCIRHRINNCFAVPTYIMA